MTRKKLIETLEANRIIITDPKNYTTYNLQVLLYEETKELKYMPKNMLEEEINAYEQMINGPCACSGVRDLMWLDTLYGEANRKGYDVERCLTIKLIESEGD